MADGSAESPINADAFQRPVHGTLGDVERVEIDTAPEQPSDGGQPHAVHDTLGDVERVEIDTAHFKGNYPDRVSLEGADFVAEKLISAGSTRLRTLLVESKLEMDKQHGFVEQINDVGRISHVRMSIYPDGGISRLRLFGRAETETRIVMITLRPRRLTPERFAAYGDVIERSSKRIVGMNHGRFERFSDLSRVEVDDNGRVSISVARCCVATSLPYRFNEVERHPLGSQAFIPLGSFPFVVVVAPCSANVEVADLRAFVASRGQGVNYRRGTWHMPLIALGEGQ